jgi:choline dehydrogenase-like flavoprotein
VNSLPLSLAIILRSPMSRSSSLATRRPESDVSATRHRHYLVQSKATVRTRDLRPPVNWSYTKSSDQRALAASGIGIGARVPVARLLVASEIANDTFGLHDGARVGLRSHGNLQLLQHSMLEGAYH